MLVGNFFSSPTATNFVFALTDGHNQTPAVHFYAAKYLPVVSDAH
jgi:hypothetical protein